MVVDELRSAAQNDYPEYEVREVRPGETANHAVEISLVRADERKRRLFDPFTGEDLGDPLPLGYRVTAWLLDLHDNLLGGPTGRRVNGNRGMLPHRALDHRGGYLVALYSTLAS